MFDGTKTKDDVRVMSAPTPPRRDLDQIWPYIPGRHRKEIERQYGVTDVLKLASNENPLGPSPLALHAIERMAAEARYYPDSRSLDLREALAELHGLARDNVVMGSGSVECIDLIARAFLRPGDGAVTGFPSFPRFTIASQIVGVEPRVVHHRDWRFDLSGIRDAIDESTRVVFIDNPCNPTGTHIPTTDLTAFLDDLPAEVLVVLDRAYFEFVSEDERYEGDLDRIRGGANLIVLRTFSKAYGLAGLRVGYALARAEHVRALDRVREAFNVNAWGQAAALAALGDDAHVRASRQLVDTERAWLASRFEAMGLEFVPSLTNFLFTNLGARANLINEGLLERGIIVRPMSAPEIASWVRVSMGTRPENERLVAALEELRS